MAKASPAFTNFTAGELSPRLDGRTDLAKYQNGCKALQNFIVHPHGGASRRPGTTFVREVKNSAHNARLIPLNLTSLKHIFWSLATSTFAFTKTAARLCRAAAPSR